MQCAAEQTLQQAPRLQREVEEGNTEYKYKLVQPSPERVQHLATQLNWCGQLLLACAWPCGRAVV